MSTGTPTEATISHKPADDGRPTAAIETHGCKLNQADSGALASELTEAGYRLVPTDEPADVYLVNTCTVTHIADRKARHALRSARRRNPDSLIVATGCYAQRSPDALRKLAEVDIVAGNTEKATLVPEVIKRMGGPIRTSPKDADWARPGPATMRSRAMVRIQVGCDQVCAYCIVPKVRGRERSIPPEEIVRRIEEYVSRGHKEVVLTGTQLGTYGFDLRGIDLTGLLKRVLLETGVARLRVSSLQPREIHDDMLGLWSDRRLCPHFHLPLQSGSDTVLERMRRRYSTRQYLETVERIRNAVADVSITTDVIVGFPGETAAMFEQTVDLCEEVGFAAMHVFPFSVRPGTSAAHFGGQVDPQTKSSRAQVLLSLSRRHSAEFRERHLGTTRPVLWEGPKEAMGPDHWTGLTDNYIRVVGRSQRSLRNEITPARLYGQKEDLVFAQVLRGRS
jgi:threonylcarbamoyladenosine tRNA methylthiotransferase MtaB